ncbi:MAG: hypothetical protein GY862_12355 [Gammaproteobacteria bacterium]|nr:hypothetical protein [Gammaproteobacteria bacterium]
MAKDSSFQAGDVHRDVSMQQAGRDVAGRDAVGGDVVGGDKTTVYNYYSVAREERNKAGSPYKFLSSYDISDRDIFFGRDSTSEELTGKALRHKVLLINGASGAGKSSLINAGLIPRITDKGHVYIAFRDYSDPLAQLFFYLKSGDIPPFDKEKFSLAAALQAFRGAKPLLLIFDQFERFFLKVNPENRRAFIQAFKECLDSSLSAGQITFLFAVRQELAGRSRPRHGKAHAGNQRTG